MSVASEPAANTAVEAVSVLWVDDNSAVVQNFRKLLAEQEGKNAFLAIDWASSIRLAEEKLADDNYGAVIIDCRMDDFNLDENGARFLVELNRRNRALPTFVYSAWLDDALYRPFLDQSYAVDVRSKSHRFERRLKSDSFISKIHFFGANYVSLRQLRPERIAYRDYVKDPDKFRPATDIHWRKHQHWILKDMERHGYEWCVVAGDEVVDGSDDLFEFPDDSQLRSIGERSNLVPFAYAETRIPEETGPAKTGQAWSRTRYNNDYYPTIRIGVGERDIVGDFDTGAAQTVVSEELVKKGMFDSYREEAHLGGVYKCFVKNVTLTVVDDYGVRQERKVPIQVVPEWSATTFQTVNSNRLALIGRDVLRAFEMELLLDSHHRKTFVRLL